MTTSEFMGYKVWVVNLSLSDLATAKAAAADKVNALRQRFVNGELDFDTIEIGIYWDTDEPVRVWPVWYT